MLLVKCADSSVLYTSHYSTKYKVLNVSVDAELYLQNPIIYKLIINLQIEQMASKCQTAGIASKCHNHGCFKMSLCASLTVCAQLYHAGTDAQLDANGKRQPVFPAAHGQLHHAVICEANIHSNTVHEWGNSHQVSVDYQRHAEDQDTVRHLRQRQHQRH